MRRLAALIATLVMLAASQASACVPGYMRPLLPLDRLEMARHIFTARITGIERIPLGEYREERRFHFVVEKTFRGAPPAAFTFSEIRNPGGCETYDFPLRMPESIVYVFMLPGDSPEEGYYGYGSSQTESFESSAEAEAWVERNLAELDRLANEPPLALSVTSGEAPLTVRLADHSELTGLLDAVDEALGVSDLRFECYLFGRSHPGLWDMASSRGLPARLIDWDAVPYRAFSGTFDERRVAWKFMYRYPEDLCPIREITYLLPGTYTVRATLTIWKDGDYAYVFRRSATVTVLPPAN